MMMKLDFISRLKTGLILAILPFLWGCNQSEYDRVVAQELATGVEHTEMLFDLKIGLSKKEFYGKCWQLNKDKLVSQGPSNQYVRHVLDSVSPIYNPSSKMEMLFFGLFDEEDIMRGMRFRFSYTAWAPWNKELQPEQLQEEIKTMMMTLFPGNDFFNLEKQVNDSPIAVKIDGNRLITVFVFDNRFVQAYIEDLNAKYEG
ncbi:MAG: hypothetical protein ACPG8F_02450 [Flavobacteriaceae bacterium]